MLPAGLKNWGMACNHGAVNALTTDLCFPASLSPALPPWSQPGWWGSAQSGTVCLSPSHHTQGGGPGQETFTFRTFTFNLRHSLSYRTHLEMDYTWKYQYPRVQKTIIFQYYRAQYSSLCYHYQSNINIISLESNYPSDCLFHYNLPDFFTEAVWLMDQT